MLSAGKEWNRMVGKYCRTFRESDPALVQDLEARAEVKGNVSYEPIVSICEPMNL